jgi:hypothetical protein
MEGAEMKLISEEFTPKVNLEILKRLLTESYLEKKLKSSDTDLDPLKPSIENLPEDLQNLALLFSKTDKKNLNFIYDAIDKTHPNYLRNNILHNGPCTMDKYLLSCFTIINSRPTVPHDKFSYLLFNPLLAFVKDDRSYRIMERQKEFLDLLYNLRYDEHSNQDLSPSEKFSIIHGKLIVPLYGINRMHSRIIEDRYKYIRVFLYLLSNFSLENLIKIFKIIYSKNINFMIFLKAFPTIPSLFSNYVGWTNWKATVDMFDRERKDTMLSLSMEEISERERFKIHERLGWILRNCTADEVLFLLPYMKRNNVFSPLYTTVEEKMDKISKLKN